MLLSTLLPPHVRRMCIHGWRGRRLKYRLDSMSSWVMAQASTSNRYVSDQGDMNSYSSAWFQLWLPALMCSYPPHTKLWPLLYVYTFTLGQRWEAELWWKQCDKPPDRVQGRFSWKTGSASSSSLHPVTRYRWLTGIGMGKRTMWNSVRCPLLMKSVELNVLVFISVSIMMYWGESCRQCYLSAICNNL